MLLLLGELNDEGLIIEAVYVAIGRTQLAYLAMAETSTTQDFDPAVAIDGDALVSIANYAYFFASKQATTSLFDRIVEGMQLIPFVGAEPRDLNLSRLVCTCPPFSTLLITLHGSSGVISI